VAALYLLDFMRQAGRGVTDLVEYLFGKVGPHYYDRLDIKFPAEERQEILGRVEQFKPETLDGARVGQTDASDGYRFIMDDGGVAADTASRARSRAAHLRRDDRGGRACAVSSPEAGRVAGV